MKKRILVLVGVAAFAVTTWAVVTQIKETGQGLFLGTATTQKIGFWGTTPTNQLGVGVAITNGATVAEVIVKLATLQSNLVLYGLVKTNAP